MTNPDKILIIDDHPIVLDGLAMLLLELRPGSEIFKAHNAGEARQLVEQGADLDWIFLDVMLPDLDGIELIKEFDAIRITANIVVLSSNNNPDTVDRALKQNASGFLSKSFDRDQLHKCLSTIERGHIFLANDNKRQLRHFRSSLLVEKQAIQSQITERQYEILLLITKGYNNQEIADYLKLALSTVKAHVSALMVLFDSDNRTHCSAEARRLGLLE